MKKKLEAAHYKFHLERQSQEQRMCYGCQRQESSPSYPLEVQQIQKKMAELLWLNK